MTRFEDVLDILSQSDARICARDLVKQIKTQRGVSSRSAKKILQTLIDSQELCYHYLYGTTYIEKSFLRPVRISDHFILTPPEFFNPESDSDDIQIVLQQGISFGSGQHSTTRLCLQAIDLCFFQSPDLQLDKADSGVDIGTGSGVLAFAMCLAGLCKCQAHEIDPISINEAKKNITHNRLETQIHLLPTPFAEDKNKFSIICANLR
ncbi:MAG: 50S ribosomal protein L11 methyltransferase [Proteobacteria bacterium]|nr:50S ribosomal protein L11 methyltransferase [Pseudomonadota bacterium]